MNISIPAALAVEVAENPERFRPSIRADQPILVLHRPFDRGEVGLLGRALGYCPPEPGITFASGNYSLSGVCDAWAPVGETDSPDSSWPPAVGDRVLVLDSESGNGNTIGHVGTVRHVPRPGPCGNFHQPDDWSGDPGAILVDFDPGVPFPAIESIGRTISCRVTRWAILPPTLADTVKPELPDRPGETAHVERNWHVGTNAVNSGRVLCIDGRPVGMMESAELTAQVVEAMNDPGREIERLNALLRARIESDEAGGSDA